MFTKGISYRGYYGSPTCPGQVNLEVGQVNHDTYLPEGQVQFLEKVSNISSFIQKFIGRAGIFNIRAGTFLDLLAQGQVT